MKRRLYSALLLAATLIGATLAYAPAASANVFAPCFGADPSHTNQITLNRFASYVGANYMDAVRGEVVAAQDLSVCLGTGGLNTANGQTAVLMADVESASGLIYQIGYTKVAGQPDNDFTYVDGNGLSLWAFKSTGERVVAVPGHDYIAVMSKASVGGHVLMSITEKTATTNVTIWSKDLGVVWSSALNHAWWGYETLDDVSNHGHDYGSPRIILTQMGYSTDQTNSWIWRSDINSTDISCTGTGCNSNRIKTIMSVTYTHDSLDVATQ